MPTDLPNLTDFSDFSVLKAFADLSADFDLEWHNASADEKESLRQRWLGRKQGRLGLISSAWLKSAPADAKRLLGSKFNELKQQIESRFATQEHDAALSATKPAPLDPTLPGTRRPLGA